MHWDNDPAEGENIEAKIFSCLRKIINTVDIYAAKLKEKTGLNSSQLSCLLALERTGSLPLSKLSKKVALSPSMITAIVDQLENKELVARNRKTADRRVILIELTEKGKEVVKEAPPSFQEQMVNSLSYLKEDEKETIHENLSKLLSIVVSEVLIDSALLGIENTLVEVAPSVLKTDEKK